MDFVLNDGWTIIFTTDTDKYDAVLAVLDDTGNVINETDDIFEGVLGWVLTIYTLK